MGCEHGRDVGHAAARSAPAGLLRPHGQTQTRAENNVLTHLLSCFSDFYGNHKSTLSKEQLAFSWKLKNVK